MGPFYPLLLRVLPPTAKGELSSGEVKTISVFPFFSVTNDGSAERLTDGERLFQSFIFMGLVSEVIKYMEQEDVRDLLWGRDGPLRSV